MLCCTPKWAAEAGHCVGGAPRPRVLTHLTTPPLLSPTLAPRSKKTYYCNADCQKADWKAHKGGCHEPLAPPKVYEVKCAGCGGYGEGLVGDNGKCAHCTRTA
jgi:hypothetical protein